MVAAGELGPALAAAEWLRSANRGAPAAHVLAGDVLMAMNRPADAANAYRDAANIQFSEPAAMRFVAALQKSGQSAAALRVLQLFLGQNPRSVRALRLAAEHHMTSGQWDRAIGILQDLRLRLGNRDATLLANLGWAWFRKGNTGRALAYSGAAYRLAPSNPAVAKGYGLILVQSGKDKAGGAALLKTAERLPVAN
jgi:tetratricopeptide (TPR) repeat protein